HPRCPEKCPEIPKNGSDGTTLTVFLEVIASLGSWNAVVGTKLGINFRDVLSGAPSPSPPRTLGRLVSVVNEPNQDFRKLTEHRPFPGCFPSTCFDSLLRLLRPPLTICLQFLVARFAAMFPLVLMQFLQARTCRSVQLLVPFCPT